MPTEVAKILARRVVAARTRHGLTQAALAEAVDVTNETISRIERGRFEPSLTTACRLAKALGVSLDYLAGGLEGAQSTAHATSPVVRRISGEVANLAPDAQRALLALAKLLGKTPR